MFVGLRNVLLLSVCLMFAAGQAGAVALGKIEVTSHLGETFFAEAPLQLDAGEKVSDVTVEMAAPSDYQILEVFRDPALNNLSVDIVNDLRGPRAVISSNQAVDTPYFNLVLKLRHGHATNFKKYPVFLDLPEQVRPAAPEPVQPAPVEEVQPVQEVPAVSAVDISPVETAPVYEPAPVTDTVEEAAIEPTGSEFNPYDGWARTSRYGPMVRGDTVTTVARRLRVDERYTLNQVMVGLFNKNKDKFRENNINLINAGTYLNVPSAAEVESIPASQAEALIKQQEQNWKNLRNQPVYAAEAEAQENRYRTRVHVGQSAAGTAAAPMQQDVQDQADTSAMGDQSMQQGDVAAQPASDPMRALQEENLRLQQALQESEARAASAPLVSADAAAAEEQVKKLELTVARLQRQLKLMDQQLEEVRSQDMNSLTYAMAGIIVLLIGVAGYLLFLLRRDRPHPSMVNNVKPSDAAPVVAAMPAPAAQAMSGDDDADAATMDAGEFAASLDSETGVHADIGTSDDSLMFEQKAPKAEAGVDYLAEAEVYLRYGMDDEALQQMHLAIEQQPDNAGAHTMLVQFLRSRGDQAALTAAIEAARSALGGSDLEAFDASLSEAASGAGDETVALATADEPVGDAEIDFDEIMAMVGETQDESASDDSAGVADELGLDFGDMDADVPAKADDDAALSFDDILSEALPEEEAAGSGAENQTEEEEPAVAVDAEGDLDFVSSIEISEASEEQAPAEETDEDVHGLDFAFGDATPDAELNDVLDTLSSDEAREDDDSGLSFETASNDAGEPESADAATEIASSDDDDLGLDAILGEFGKDSEEAAGIDFASAGSGVTAFDQGKDDASVPESVIDAAASDDELGLDDILGQFGSFEDDSEQIAAEDGQEAADAASDIVGLPEMDVSDELDDLLAEWGEEGTGLDFEAGAETLDLDRARSLLAEGELDEAEAALKSVLDGERRGDALIGLAEVAAKRGDAARSNELLGEAESLLDDSNRDWFESVKNLSV